MKNYCTELDIVGIARLHIHQLFAYRFVRVGLSCLIWRTTWRTDCTWRFAMYFISPASPMYRAGGICTIGSSVLSAGILAFGWRKEDRWRRRRGEHKDDDEGGNGCERDGKGNRDGLANRGKLAALDSLSDRKESDGNNSGNFIRRDCSPAHSHVIPVQSSISRHLYRRVIEELPNDITHLVFFFFLFRDMARRSLPIPSLFLPRFY